jgi:REP element-mobilizing transposase RayT
MEPDYPAYPELKFLDGAGEIRRHHNRLPHWQQSRTACFVTFRLWDSIPADLLSEWREDRDAWLAEHPKPWSAATEMSYHLKFSARIDRWMDEGYGSCVLADSFMAEMLGETLHMKDGTDYHLHSWVIMPNHVHVLFSPTAGLTLPKIVAAWKRFSATKIHKTAGTSGSLWQKDYFDRLIRDWDHFMNVARYIRNNPGKATLGDKSYSLYEAEWVKRLLS